MPLSQTILPYSSQGAGVTNIVLKKNRYCSGEGVCVVGEDAGDSLIRSRVLTRSLSRVLIAAVFRCRSCTLVAEIKVVGTHLLVFVRGNAPPLAKDIVAILSSGASRNPSRLSIPSRYQHRGFLSFSFRSLFVSLVKMRKSRIHCQQFMKFCVFVLFLVAV